MASSAAAASIAAHKSSKTGDDLLTTDLGKNDYDWLLTPPGTPLVNPPDHTSSAYSDHISSVYGDDFLSHAVLPNLVRSLAAIKTSRLSGSKAEPSMKREPSNGPLLSMRPDPSMRSGRNGIQRSTAGVTASSSYMTNNATSMTSRRTPVTPTGSRPTSRPTTPTKRSTTSSTPVSRPTTPTSRPKVASAPVSRPTTPTSRSRVAPTPVSRPATPTNRSTISTSSKNGDSNVIYSSMTTRGSVASRPTTPLRRPVAPQAQPQSVSATATRSSSVIKGRPAPSRSTPSSRGSSPTAKPNAWQQLSDIPGFSLEPPPNLRTSLPTRSSSNSRGASVSALRPGAPSTGSTMATTARAIASSEMPSERPLRPGSPSLARGRSGVVPSSTGERQSAGSTVMMRNGGKFDKSSGDTVVKSSKGVDRMILSRRPFPSSLSPETALSMSQIKQVIRPSTPTAASKDSTGYGRNTPRKSTDLPTRHMELRQSASNGLRSLVRSIPTSSLYSVRPAGMRVLANSSPMATSSNASSDHSMSIVRDPEGSELGEEFISEANKASPASQSDSLSSLIKNAQMNNWLGSPEYKDGTSESIVDGTPESNQATQHCIEKSASVESIEKSANIESIEKFASIESSPVCRHGCVAANCELCNMKIRLQRLNEKCRASLRASLQLSEDTQQRNSLGNGNL
eukprot:c15745_g1_i1 orf=286-2328(+)